MPLHLRNLSRVSTDGCDLYLLMVCYLNTQTRFSRSSNIDGIFMQGDSWYLWIIQEPSQGEY